MASDGDPVKIPATSLVHGSQAPTTVVFRSGGNPLPQSGSVAAQAASKAALAKTSEPVKNVAPQALVTFLNKFLNDSGRPDQFRIDPKSNANIQEVNPATGEVIAEYSVAEFPALARSVGATGGLVDGHA